MKQVGSTNQPNHQSRKASLKCATVSELRTRVVNRVLASKLRPLPGSRDQLNLSQRAGDSASPFRPSKALLRRSRGGL